MIFIPFLGAFALAIITLMEKFTLKRKKLPIRTFHTYSFLASVIFMIPLIYFFWHISAQAFELKNILLFLLIISFSILANLLSFYSIKWEKITNIEPALMTEPLFTILLAVIFSFFFTEYERNLNVVIPAVIAGSALIFSHIKKHHLEFNKYFIAAIFASLFFAIELVLSRLILDFYSPISFYFLRCSAIFLISFAIFRPSAKTLDTKLKKEILLIGFLWVAFRIALYYGYIYVGVVTTTLIVLLAPALIYLFAWKFLKEKPSIRNIAAAVVILLCIIYVVLK